MTRDQIPPELPQPLLALEVYEDVSGGVQGHHVDSDQCVDKVSDVVRDTDGCQGDLEVGPDGDGLHDTEEDKRGVVDDVRYCQVDYRFRGFRFQVLTFGGALGAECVGVLVAFGEEDD